MMYIKKMFKFMRPYMLPYSVGVFLSNSQAFVFSFVIGLVGSSIMAGAIAGDTRAIVDGTLIALGVFACLLSLVGLGRFLYLHAKQSAQMDLKKQLFRSFMKRGLEASQSSHRGEGVTSINTDADSASDIYTNALFPILSPIIAGTLSSVTLFIIDIRMGLAAICLGGFVFFVQSRFIKPVARIGKERLESNAKSVKDMSDVFQGAMTIRAFNLQEKVLDSARSRMSTIMLLDFQRAFISMFQQLFTTLQGLLALVATFGLGGWLVATGQLEFPLLLLALPLFEGISTQMGKIGEAVADMQPTLEAAKRVIAVIDSVPTSNDKGSLEFNGSALQIRGLSFKYQTADESTLHDINLDINVGEMVAFVGASGSGKSTILRILVGFYEREQLGMTLGDTSSDSVSIEAWRKNFAYVDQSCKLFDMTIKENISLGLRGKADDAAIVAAAKQAYAHDFIENLDEKYNSPCGEKGASLSGGQKQRIAIARALIKGSPIIVFDEATSALDGDSERYVMDTIQALRKDRTILITTHSLATITNADKIVVLEKGRIAEIGKHDELMEKKGVYHDLYTAQTIAVRTSF